jgi:predicted DNA-binding transcriptional regulator AlpA
VAENNDPQHLDGRIRGTAKGPKQRARDVEKIVADTEKRRPSAPRGLGEHRWPEPRGPPELWRLPKVLSVTGLKQSQLLDAVARGIFPRPVKILAGGRANAWLSTEIIAHIEARIAARDMRGET